ncbi:alkaline protease [Priestia endophytica]|uniref:alkaline protease n=1 Tax=Priestia endophytica TaxID=135735 RepID=UPI000DCA63CE|nr:alkaline protease [Priestia endophytica]RAS89617.1 alkaline protease [Priestia endophytica]
MADFELICDAETDVTSITGVRDSKWSDWSKVTAPEGFVINKEKVVVEALVEMGSENTYEREWLDYVEIIPGTGIELPRTMSVRAHARSSKGHRGGKGHSRYRFSGDFTKLP